jgi:alpha-1,6-mannosyltransferase
MESTPASADSAVEPAAAIRPALPALPRLEARRRALIANTMLGGMVVAAFLMAAGAAAKHYGPTLHIHHGLPSALRGPLHGLDLSLSGTEFGLVFIVLGLCYLGVLAFADSIRVRLGIGAIVLLHVLFVIAPPLLSSDLFNYVGYARLDVVHGLNPYVHPLSAAPTDPSYIYVGWPLNTTAYGPLFTVASLPLGWVSFTAGIWTLKTVTALASLACVALVWACATRLGRPPLPATLFFGLNPILLAYAVGGAHNDVLIMVFGLAGVLALLRTRERLAGAALAGAAAVKLTGGLLLPFALLASRRRSDVLVGAGVTVAAIFGLGLLLWGPQLLGGLEAQREVGSLRSIPGLYGSILFGATDVTSTMLWVGARSSSLRPWCCCGVCTTGRAGSTPPGGRPWPW